MTQQFPMQSDVEDILVDLFGYSEPVEEGSTGSLELSSSLVKKDLMLFDSSAQTPPVISLGTDYTSPEADQLNRLVQANCLHPQQQQQQQQRLSLNRTQSVDELLKSLNNDDEKMEIDGDEEFGGGFEDLNECNQQFDAALEKVKTDHQADLPEVLFGFQHQFSSVSSSVQQQSLPTVIELQQQQQQQQQQQPSMPFVIDQQTQQQTQQTQQQMQQQQPKIEVVEREALPSFLQERQQHPPQSTSTVSNLPFMLESLGHPSVQVTQLPEAVQMPEETTTEATQAQNLPNLTIMNGDCQEKDEVDSIASSFAFCQSPLEEVPISTFCIKDELKLKADHVKEELARIRGSSGSSSSDSSKVQVSEFLLFLLQHEHCSCGGAFDFSGLFTLCSQNGSADGADHFMAIDTKEVGRLWQAVKGNRNSNYDTFARGLRVGRERQKGIIEYLDSGKGSKKRIYKFSEKGLQELREMKRRMRR